MKNNFLDKLSEILINDFWHMVGHKSELEDNDSFFKLILNNKEIVVFNDNGIITAFDNICPHRGTKILRATNGKSPITCPYHSWTYKNGELKIPNKKKYTDCDIDSADINKLDICFCGDFIFVGLEPKMSLDRQLSGLSSVLETISYDISNRLDFDSYEFDSIFPIAIENALEAEHLPSVHKNSLARLKLQEGEYSFLGNNSFWQSPIGNKKIDRDLEKIKENFDISTTFSGYRNYLIFPFAMLSSTYGYSYSLQNFLPGKNNKTYFNSRFFSSKTKNNAVAMDPFFKGGIEINKQIFREDAEICSFVLNESWSFDDPKYSKGIDARIKEFRKNCKSILMKV